MSSQTRHCLTHITNLSYRQCFAQQEAQCRRGFFVQLALPQTAGTICMSNRLWNILKLLFKQTTSTYTETDFVVEEMCKTQISLYLASNNDMIYREVEITFRDSYGNKSDRHHLGYQTITTTGTMDSEADQKPRRERWTSLRNTEHNKELMKNATKWQSEIIK